MKTRIGHQVVYLACMMIILCCFWGCSEQQTENADKTSSARPTISDAERALAMLEVQNTYSKHAYYHSVGQHLEELADIWVKEDGPYAATATWTSAMGIWEGMPLIKEYYGTYTQKNRQRALEEVSKKNPEIKNVPENLGVGTGYVMHTQTTPIIEIAGDGKTAKGMWYSPGISINGVEVNGKVEQSGGWFMEKYAVDFVKEDGNWKIWHIGMYYDPTPPGWGAQRQRQAAAVQTGEQPETLQQVKPTKPNPDPYTGWTPTWVPRIQPKFPVPYYTFSETFSY